MSCLLDFLILETHLLTSSNQQTVFSYSTQMYTMTGIGSRTLHQGKDTMSATIVLMAHPLQAGQWANLG